MMWYINTMEYYAEMRVNALQYTDEPHKVERRKTVMLQAWAGKQFPAVRQYERKIEFVRTGDAVRIAGQLK